MKKKYPKEWVTKMQELIGLAVYSKVDFAVDKFLFELDAAGMLREVPEPLETEYCVIHGSTRISATFCEYSNANKALSSCTFVKMREVVE